LSSSLPRHGENAEHADQVPGEESFPQGSETVLVAEDNDMVRELTQEILTDRGYEVLAASGPEECLALSRQYQGGIDLLLTDVIMPSSNGQTLFERIREQRNGVKVIFMSGYTDNVIGASGVLDEGVHFIQKPFSSQALARKVREVLDQGSYDPSFTSDSGF
jgi:DNA-binding NtrC family response regulator